MNKIKAIKNPNDVCFKCLGRFSDNKLNIIHISSLGYGSEFDGWSTEIHLCEDCIKETNREWWELEVVREEYCEEYRYESEIFKFVRTLPLEGRELFWNRFSTDNYTMDAQDWIDYELDILSHEKCKEYGMYSPQERKAYEERFPNCDKVKIVVYDDGSQGSRCPFGAFGDDDGNCGLNIYDECYNCDFFENRKDKIEMCDEEDMKIFELERELAMAKIMKKLKSKKL